MAYNKAYDFPMQPKGEEKQGLEASISYRQAKIAQAKQRGIYSELLGGNADYTAATVGPKTDMSADRVQRAPGASTFRANGGTNLNKKAKASPRKLVDGPVAPKTLLEPKVNVPFQTKPGQVPRRIEIERKKRLFSTQDVNELLLEQGVDYLRHSAEVDHENGKPSYLPLDIFDDTDLEYRSPEEWLRLSSTTVTNGACNIKAKALRFDLDDQLGASAGRFLSCTVVGYDMIENKYIVEWQDTQQTARCNRINVCFHIENPFQFAMRVGRAHALRREFEASIRYSLYVDSMPTDELQSLDSEQINRILLLAMNTRRLKQNALDSTSLLQEVNIDYARTMNKIIFDINLQDPSQTQLRMSLRVPAKNKQAVKRVPYLGVVSVPFHDFPKHFSDFCFHSFYTKLEAIVALVKVNVECLKLERMNLFNTAIPKSVRLDEFDSLQGSNINQLFLTLKEKWIMALKGCVKSSLRDVGKGWFNLGEKNREVYAFSKLKKFMSMINFVMQDKLRYLIEDSLAKYAAFMRRASCYSVAVASTNSVIVSSLSISVYEFKPVDEIAAEEAEHKRTYAIRKQWLAECEHARKEDKPLPAKPEAVRKEDLVDEEKAIDKYMSVDAANFMDALNKLPNDFCLFTVDMTIKDNMIQYTTQADMILATVLRVFDSALSKLKEIPQLETHVMKHLFLYGNDVRMGSVLIDEPWVQGLYGTIERYMSAALKPMAAYLQEFKKYDDFLKLDVEQYVKEKEAAEMDTRESRVLIQQHVTAAEQVDKDLPKSIWLGLVTINCEDVRRQLVTKRRTIIQKLLDVVAKQAKDNCQDIGLRFKKIEQELKKAPDDIHQLTKLNEYVASIPQLVGAERQNINDAISAFDMLDEFNYRISKENFRLKWATFSWAKTIHDEVEEKERALQNDKNVFLNDMKTKQEEFAAELLEVEKRVNSFGTNSDMLQVAKIAGKCQKISEKLSAMQIKAREFNGQESQFDVPITDYKNVQQIMKNFEPYFLLWTTVDAWLSNHDSWMTDSFLNLNGERITDEVTGYARSLVKALKAKVIKENAAVLKIASSMQTSINDFTPYLPLVAALRNPGMRERHWVQMKKKLPEVDFPIPDETMTLTRILQEYHLDKHIAVIQEIGETAGKEFGIESVLDKMENAWKGQEYVIKPYKTSGTFVVSELDAIIQTVDEHIMTTQAMQFSPYKGPFDERIHLWSSKLTTVSELIQEWIKFQRQWLGLQSIFASPDINRQLPQEGKKFSACNKIFRTAMQQVQTNPDVLTFSDNPALLQKFVECNADLAIVNKRLSDYLDKKRAAFPRFFFLADEDLLAILSQTADPTAVQPHLKKCFENVHAVTFQSDNSITAMFSGEKEEVPFKSAVHTRDKNVEHWLNEVEKAMCAAVAHSLEEGVADYPLVNPNKTRNQWVLDWPAQVIIAASSIWWTKEAEDLMNKEAFEGTKKFYQKQVAQVLDLVALVRGNLTKLQSMTIGALIVIEVHARDVIEKLVQAKVSNVSDFDWICQLRYYQEEEQLWVQMVQARFPYSYEYLGNSLRLVITPLTDRCYMTLMTALSLTLGGAPAGPAGTGKTETVKDLAKAVAKFCVVFNCSEGLNYIAMAKFFKGLASSGAWACFDEFNRIDVEVLSVVAQQIMTIYDAIKEGVSHFVFDETDLGLVPTCAVFITMNPGYAGRTELPDNLKALFRPMAMMVPDYGLIGEIMLYSFGFTDAKRLARKMVTTFKLASEQLSSQDHYDYGMRAVKTVITRAGILKREDPDQDEDILLLRALLDVNMPKFLKQDLPLFGGIMADLFMGKQEPEKQYANLTNALISSAREMKMQPVPIFLHKCIQVYETVIVRHGLMLVGPTGGGKSRMLNNLKDALCKLHKIDAFYRCEISALNPKAVTMAQLYGDLDVNTKEWTDGILATVVRKCIVEADPESYQWVLFDGPVDALWIENMNTVLDDNKKLCLVSQEILSLTPLMRMIFEVEDLAVASPATVSRCGMVYIEPVAMGNLPQIRSWLEYMPKEFTPAKKTLRLLFTRFLEPVTDFVRRSCTEPVPTVDNNLCGSCIRLMQAFMAPYKVDPDARLSGDEAAKAEEDLAQFNNNVAAYFMMALVWSVGASVDREGRLRFNHMLRSMCNTFAFSHMMPDSGTVYDYKWVPGKKWVTWMDGESAFTIDPKLSFNEIVVPTADSVRYSFLLKVLSQQGFHVLMTGNTGTGKTVNVERYLMRMPDTYQPIQTCFSAATSANQTEDMLFSKMKKRRTKYYGPPLGKKFFIFIDDMNMPLREKYFAQPPIELLRQWMDFGGWYNHHDREFNNIVDISFIGAMGPPGGGRNVVTPRFLRHFNQVAHTDQSSDILAMVFSTIVGDGFKAYANEIGALTHPIVNATIECYEEISKSLLPTPTRSHYTFNVRDLAKVFQGVLSSNPKKLKSVTSLLRLWVHEARRVFNDRLINDADRLWFNNQLKKSMLTHFKTNWDDVIPERLLFGDYLEGISADNKIYEEVTDVTKLYKLMGEYLEEYNAENLPMKLFLFFDAVEHVSRIARILRSPGGNALLLGVGGSGRSSLTRLANYVCDYKLFMVQVDNKFGMTEWREAMKGLLLNVGLKETPTTFLFLDTQITKESFLEDVNNILNSGEIPNLYAQEDLDQIFVTCKQDCATKGIPQTAVNAYSQFLARIKKNLHVVLCMSPLGEIFRTRLRMFPSLVNCCTIDWFSEWPDEALRGVANAKLEEQNLGLEDQKGVVDMFCYMHQHVTEMSEDYKTKLRRYNYVTPTSYLELLGSFKTLLMERRKDIGGLKNKLQAGIDTLNESKVTINKLEVDLKEAQPKLVIAQASVAEVMEKLVVDQADAEATKVVVAKQEADASVKAAECKAIKDDAENDLAQALPLLEAATACLKELKKADLDTIKSYKVPPGGVKLVMEAVCIMLQKDFNIKFIMGKAEGGKKAAPDYWASAVKFVLPDPNKLLAALKEFDKDNIPPNIIKQIKEYTDGEFKEDFDPEKILKISSPCRAMCMWVHAMYKYHLVALEVEPKRQLLKGAEAELEVVMGTLNTAKAKLKAVEDKLASLQAKHKAAMDEAQSLEFQVEQTKVKLDRATKLIDGLESEGERWATTVKVKTHEYANITGDILISCGAVAYHGAFTADYRNRMVDNWRLHLTKLNFPFTDGCGVLKTLGNPVAIREWNICSLPTDNLSLENAIIMDKARRWPLMIDPQGQANKFIKLMGQKKFGEKGMFSIQFTDSGWLVQIENCIRMGFWVLVQNVREDIDPVLDPLLQQQKIMINGAPHVQLGENKVPYADAFKLYMTSALPNPHYPPELQVKITLLNFTITRGGLQDQMTGWVVGKEDPSLETKKSELVVQTAATKKLLQETEDTILAMLADAREKGNILENPELIVVLGESKITSTNANEQLRVASIVEKEIDEKRALYMPVAFRAAIVYFCIADLAMVDPMYQFSLPFFITHFLKDVGDATPSASIDERVVNINDHFTKSLFQTVCRSLFESHKTLFSFLLTIAIEQGAGKVDSVEWRWLVTGGASAKTTENPAPDWLTQDSWGQILSLSELPRFKGLEVDFAAHIGVFKEYFDSSSPETAVLPEPWNSTADDFQKVMILKCLRPDKMAACLLLYVAGHMGKEYTDLPQFNLPKSYASAMKQNPLIFVLSRGADPNAALSAFASELNMKEKITSVSLGQGQEKVARRLIANGLKLGNWVVLQNCHLATSFLPELEQIVAAFNNKPEDINEDFRLWMTSMPTPKFPVSILQVGVKMTNEPPKGLRSNLTKVYSSFSDAMLNKSKKPQEFKKLLYALCFFHAVIIDRKKFGPLGWNIQYEFTEDDLSVCITQLRDFIDMYDEIPYKVIHFLTYDVNYGGRVTDGVDRRTMEVILDDFITHRSLSDDYAFSTSGRYMSLPTATKEDYLAVISTFDIIPAPEVFGMHDNAEISSAQQETAEMFLTVTNLLPREVAGGGKSREELISEIALSILHRTPPTYEVDAVMKKYPTMYSESMNTVLSQECGMYNRLLARMKKSLEDLLKALKGEMVMSGDLEEMANCMFTNQVPPIWTAVAYPSLMPLASWVSDLLARTGFLDKWIAEGIPVAFWIGGFFFPQAFLTGTLQNFARQKQKQIDMLSFGFKVYDQKVTTIKEKPESGIYMYGLYVEGARWDSNRQSLVDSRPKELFTPLPCMYLLPEENRVAPVSGVYKCPVYKELKRQGVLSTTGHSTNFVMFLEVPSDVPQSKWIKAGVALFCSLKYYEKTDF